SPGTIGEMNVAIDLPWHFEEWDEGHAIFEPLSDPQHGDLRRLRFAAYTRIVPSADAAVVARFNTGDPALLETKQGMSRVLWVTTWCGGEWSDWGVSRLFLPLVHQMLGYEVGLADGGRVRMHLVDAENEAGANTGAPPVGQSSQRLRTPG